MKKIIMKTEINDAGELMDFLSECAASGADLSVTNVVSVISIKGEEIGTCFLIEETLSDGSIVHNIEFHG